MRFSVLGRLEVIGDDGAEVRISQPRQRALLAVLLLYTNQEVLAGRLAGSVWDAAPASGGRGALQTQVWALRRVLAPARRLHTGQHGGYLFEVGPGELDAARFRELARQGRDALGRGDLPGAAGWLSQALALWGEPALADVPVTLTMGPVVQRLADERTAVQELLTEARLGLGQHADLVPELRESTAADPTNERLWEQLLLALHGAGRTAEALGAYQQARISIQAELGLEPGHGLQQLHRRILTGDPQLTQQAPSPAAPQRQAPATTPAVKATAVPRQLPAAPGHFTGRRSEVDLLVELAEKPDQADGVGGTVVISAIEGMAGIGKTALAVHAGHRLAGRFPDGQLFIDLHGYTKGHSPREPGQALDCLTPVSGRGEGHRRGVAAGPYRAGISAAAGAVALLAGLPLRRAPVGRSCAGG